MQSSPASTLPARARRAWRVAVPLLVTGSLAASGLVVVSAVGASAADAGTRAIGDAPVALNQPTDPEMGVLKPSADAVENGMFGSLTAFPVLPMHATVARNGHLVTFGTPVNTVRQSGITFDDWDPSTGAHVDTAADHGYDSFCNAAVTLMDGRILMVSGQVMDGRSADMMSMLYDPTSKAQTMGADLAYKRWYVTALRLTDSRILLLGGADAGNTGAYLTPDDNSKVAETPEIGTGTGAWTALTGATSTNLFGAYDNRWWYPRAFNSPNGGVVGFSSNAVWTLDPNGNGSAQQVAELPYNPKVSGSQVMYAPGKILIAGGGQVNNDDPVAASAKAAILDVNGTPSATLTDPMHFGRNWLNLTVLPTGDVFANGGTLVGTEAGDANAVKQSEIWNPGTHTWRTAASNQVMRTYHSTSLMLPSGAVFTGGGGNPGPVDNFNAEMYYPSYLFTKDANGAVQWASRPAITSIAGSATYGGKVDLTIGDGRQIASASLITLPSVTHSQSTDQRRIPLDVTQNGGTVSATLPGSVDTMPPGDYELTVVDKNGVPSPAQIITVRQGQAGQVTVGTAANNPTVAITAAPAADKAAGQPAPAPSTGTGQGVVPVPAPSVGTGASTPGTKAVKLTRGSSIAIESEAKPGYLLSRSGGRTVLKKVTKRSSAAARKASSWIVRTGLGSKKGYSFESVARPGYYLTAPSDGTGALTVAKRSKSASFAKRVTFSSVKGVMGHDTSIHITAKSTHFLRTDGKRAVVGTLGESSSRLKAATFDIEKGLARR